MRVAIVAALAGIILAPASPALAGTGGTATCGDLWVARNSLYGANGYCFKTSRAIQAFGNAGCRYDDMRDVPLSANARQRLSEILRDEAAMGCQN